VAPAGLIGGFVAARRFVDVHLPPLEQMALADFIAEGHFTRHLRRMRLLYRERRDALIEALKSALGDLLQVGVPEAGMHLVAWLPQGRSARPVTQRATAYGLRLLPISVNRPPAPPRDGLMLGFASDTSEALRAGVRTLARVLRAP